MTESITPSQLLPEVRLLTTGETAKKLRMSRNALNVMRHRRHEPALPFVKFNRRVLYRLEDIEAFIKANLDPGVGPKPARARKRKARKEIHDGD